MKSPARSHQQLHLPQRRRGMVVIYVGLIMMILLGMVTLGVDVGRLRTSKAQLSTAADAAAFAGALAIPDADWDATAGAAVAVAGSNFCDGVSVQLQQAQDIEFALYRYMTNTYTPAGSAEPGGHVVRLDECNAIRVTARRIQARGNPINLVFAQIIGQSSKDVVASATAFVRGGASSSGIVGLDWVEMSGTTRTDSYSSEPYNPSNFNSNGTVMSNGPIRMVGTTDIWGDARPGINHFVDRTQNTNVHGWEGPLDELLVFPPASVPSGVANSGALNLQGSATRTLSPGTYWFTSIRMTGNSRLIIQPNVKVYVTGNIDMSGGSVTNPGAPSGFELFKVGGGQVTLSGGSILKAHVYAPTANVSVGGTGSFGLYGWVIGRTLTVGGNSQIHYDETLPDDEGPYRTILIK